MYMYMYMYIYHTCTYELFFWRVQVHLLKKLGQTPQRELICYPPFCELSVLGGLTIHKGKMKRKQLGIDSYTL